MKELANTEKGELSLLTGLAMQARTLAQSAAMNMLQLGRVLCEAKPLVQHGDWDSWIKDNAYMKRRTAESYMQAYKTFGLNAKIAELGTTKVMKLLPMNEEDREALLSEQDVSAMSTRQLDDAIRKRREKLILEARAEVQSEIEREREARIAAEKRASAVKSNASDVSAEILRLKKEIAEKDELIEEQQEEYNRTQAELLSVRSTIAKGDAERIPIDQLTPDAFASAVRAFIGICARLPHMTAAFSTMDFDEWREYDELLRTIESWTKDSRKALDTVMAEGVVIDNG